MIDMTEREKRIAEITMAHIYTWTDGKTNVSDIKFSPKALRAAVQMIDDTIGIIEFNATLDYLVEQKYLKKLGAHLYGLGLKKGLKRYPVTDQSLLQKPHDPGFNNSKNKKLLDNQAAAPVVASARRRPEINKPARQKPEKTKPVVASKEKQSSAKPEKQTPGQKVVNADTRLIQELDDINSRLAMTQKQTIQDKDTKLMVLQRLIDMMKPIEPLTADLLSQIKTDLQGDAA